MSQIKILTLDRKQFFVLTQFIILVGMATIAPLFSQQMVAGPIINATLFISVMLLGIEKTILVGLIPSLIALSVGLLPPMLAPMIPFIMAGNTLLIMVFGYLKEKNYWLGIISASILKFIFLASTSEIVINLLLKKEIASKVALMMSWPQLLTALIGGLLAYLFLKTIKKI